MCVCISSGKSVNFENLAITDLSLKGDLDLDLDLDHDPLDVSCVTVTSSSLPLSLSLIVISSIAVLSEVRLFLNDNSDT